MEDLCDGVCEEKLVPTDEDKFCWEPAENGCKSTEERDKVVGIFKEKTSFGVVQFHSILGSRHFFGSCTNKGGSKSIIKFPPRQ